MQIHICVACALVSALSVSVVRSHMHKHFHQIYIFTYMLRVFVDIFLSLCGSHMLQISTTYGNNAQDMHHSKLVTRGSIRDENISVCMCACEWRLRKKYSSVYFLIFP
jgi:hypothetical protein